MAEHAETAARLRREVVDVLLDAREPETGRPLFDDAFDVAERLGVDPAAEGLPDVLAPSADGFQAQAKWSPFRRDLLRPDPNLPATHYREGVLAIDAPGLRPGDHLVADLHDIAPTAMALLGLRVPEPMEGRALNEAFAAPLRFRYGARPVVEVDPGRDALLIAAGFGAEAID
jgi:hypothetical protein